MVWSRISGSLILSLYGLLSLSACSSEQSTTLESEPPIERPATADLPCNDAWGVVPATWTQLSHDDGKATQTSPARAGASETSLSPAPTW